MHPLTLWHTHSLTSTENTTHTIIVLYCDLCRVLSYQHSVVLGGEEKGEGLCTFHNNVILHLLHTPTHTGSAGLESQLCRHGNIVKSSCVYTSVCECVCVCVCVVDGGDVACVVHTPILPPPLPSSSLLTSSPSAVPFCVERVTEAGISSEPTSCRQTVNGVEAASLRLYDGCWKDTFTTGKEG